MLIDEWVILRLIAVVTLGILFFDLYLLLCTPKRMTISRGIVRAPAWVQIVLVAAMAFLIWHFWGP